MKKTSTYESTVTFLATQECSNIIQEQLLKDNKLLNSVYLQWNLNVAV